MVSLRSKGSAIRTRCFSVVRHKAALGAPVDPNQGVHRRYRAKRRHWDDWVAATNASRGMGRRQVNGFER